MRSILTTPGAALAALVLALQPLSAGAKPTRPSAATTTARAYIDDCYRRDSNAAVADCVSEGFDRRDKILNEKYETLLSRLDAGRREPLRKAERAWIAFRDAQCDFEQTVDILGELNRAIVLGCMLRLTDDRVAELTRLSQ